MKVLEDTRACATPRPGNGQWSTWRNCRCKFRQSGEYKSITYDDVIISLGILDRKHVILLSTVVLSTFYSCEEIDTGRKHWKTKEAMTKQKLIHCYKKYVGDVNSNDQLMQYSAFSRQTGKWWKKAFFGILNLTILNSSILYEWLLPRHTTKVELRKVTQTEFHR